MTIPALKLDILAGRNTAEPALAQLNTSLKLVQGEQTKTGAGATKLAGNLSQVGGAAKQGAGALGGLGTAAGAAAKLLGPLSALLIATSVVKFVAGTVEAAGALHDLSQQTGLTVESLSVLKVAGDRSEVSLEQIGKAVPRLAGALGKLRDGSSEVVDTFARLGLSAGDFTHLNADEAFLKVGNAIAGVGDDIQRTELAVKVFGRSGAELLPLLNDLAGNGFARLRDELQKKGGITSTEQAARADEFGDALHDLGNEASSAGRAIGLALIPPLTGLLKLWNDGLATLREWNRTLGNFSPSHIIRPQFDFGQPSPEAPPSATGPTANRSLGHRAAPWSPSAEELARIREAQKAAEREAEARKRAADEAERLNKVLIARLLADQREGRIERAGGGNLVQSSGGTLPESVAAIPAILQGAEQSGLKAEAGAQKLARAQDEQANKAERARQQAQALGDALTQGLSRGLELAIFGSRNLGEALSNIFGSLADSLASHLIDKAAGALVGSLKLAEGGYVTGPGTSTSDSIPARLSAGEYVVNAAATAQNFDLLNSINAGTRPVYLPPYAPQHYAAGGLVAAGGNHTLEVILPEGVTGRVTSESDVLSILVRNRRKIRQVLG